MAHDKASQQRRQQAQRSKIRSAAAGQKALAKNPATRGVLRSDASRGVGIRSGTRDPGQKFKQKFGVGGTRARIRSAGSSLKAQFGGPKAASPVRNISGSSKSLRDVKSFKGGRSTNPNVTKTTRQSTGQTGKLGTFGLAKGKPLANAPAGRGGSAGGGRGGGGGKAFVGGQLEGSLLGGGTSLGLGPAGGSATVPSNVTNIRKRRKKFDNQRNRR